MTRKFLKARIAKQLTGFGFDSSAFLDAEFKTFAINFVIDTVQSTANPNKASQYCGGGGDDDDDDDDIK